MFDTLCYKKVAKYYESQKTSAQDMSSKEHDHSASSDKEANDNSTTKNAAASGEHEDSPSDGTNMPKRHRRRRVCKQKTTAALNK